MNDKIIELALKTPILNYVDLETPRRYFVPEWVEPGDIEEFAKLIINECADVCESFGQSGDGYTCRAEILEKFGVE